MRSHGVDDRLRDRTRIEGRRSALGNRAERGREFWIAQRGAFVLRFTFPGLQKVSGNCWLRAQPFDGTGDRRVKTRRDRKTLLGESDGGHEESGPWQLPVFLMRQL